MLNGTDLEFAYSMDASNPQPMAMRKQQQRLQQYDVQTPSVQTQGVPVSIYSQKIREAFDESQMQTSQPVQRVQTQQTPAAVVASTAPIVPTVPSTTSIQNNASYLDQMINRRRDILKMVIFAMSIVLAISLHTLVDFWLREISLSNELAFKQELGIRFLYPVLVVIFLWILKSFVGSK